MAWRLLLSAWPQLAGLSKGVWIGVLLKSDWPVTSLRAFLYCWLMWESHPLGRCPWFVAASKPCVSFLPWFLLQFLPELLSWLCSHDGLWSGSKSHISPFFPPQFFLTSVLSPWLKANKSAAQVSQAVALAGAWLCRRGASVLSTRGRSSTLIFVVSYGKFVVWNFIFLISLMP